ncbi:hypothetical protein HK099_000281 [Clydaea vesicula]|uniref:Uncharacterized protein n=1 Tax=Clydaea vesicula TaxID=447962 RepID=A0AAD5U840_9FUNG|nr:hypothetical protein HK099_000281 [Clydaea vesicula]
MQERIEQFFINRPENTEIEARFFGYFAKKDSMVRVLEKYQSNIINISYTECRCKSSTNKNSTYRLRNNVELTCKTMLIRENFEDMWFNICVSSEEPVDITRKDEIFGQHPELIHINRYRIVYKDCYIDFGENVEVEITPQSTSESLYEAITWIIKELQDSSEIVTKTTFSMINNIKKSIDIVKPVTLTRYNVDLLEKAICISPKYDGERRLLILHGGKTIDVDMTDKIRFLDIPYRGMENVTVLDCELIADQYHIMEILIFNGKNLKDEGFAERIQHRENFGFHVKEYYLLNKLEDIMELYKHCTNPPAGHSINMPIDGIIIVTEHKILKWKPIITVDLRFSDNVPEKYQGWKIVDTNRNSSTGSLLTTNLLAGSVPLNIVCEFIINYKNRTLTFYRPRPDKAKPNSKKVFDSNTKFPIDDNAMKGIGFLFLRQYISLEKSSMLSTVYNNVKDKVLIDVGSGIGNDVNKWKTLKYKKIYCIEPRKEYIDIMYSRYGKSKNITTICDYISGYDNFSKRLPKASDVVSLFLCMQLFTNHDFEGLGKLLMSNLKIGGKLIGIICHNVEDYNDGILTCRRDNAFYTLTMKGTSVQNSRENIIDVDYIHSWILSLGFVNDFFVNIENRKYMPQNERKVLGWYMKFQYTKINP